MASDLGPDQVRQTQFRGALRGVDRSEVEAFLEDVAARIEELDEEKRRLQEQLGESASRDLETEFESIGRDVAGILQSAREAADSMRERATLDAARWRSESMADAEKSRREASADAEAMRRDAWTVGTEMLQQSSEESRKEREQAERDVLTVMGEAEREAHRLTSGARREAEDVVRSASMDADKMIAEATKRRDDIVEAANRAAAQAQERTRALEQRRDELLEELENVRSTLTRLEGSLDEKRETLDLSSESSTSVKVVSSRPPVVEDDGEMKVWEPGETVRVVPPDRTSVTLPPVDRAEEPDDEAPIAEPPEPALEEPEAPREPQAPAVEETPTPEPVVVEVVDEVEPDGDDVGALFASLRDGGHPEEPVEADAEETGETQEEQLEAASPAETDPRDWIDERDSRLLPITNRALRGAKKSITELQNIALDSLRTDEDWRPDADVVAAALHAELIGAWAESFAAGHGVAEEMTGSKLKRPTTPQSSAPADFASALSEAVAVALSEAGEGQRERQSAASRVYRVWRTDEAERRIRELAIHAYEQAIESSVSAGSTVG
jgi:DivIVA domain-containing protein